MKRDQLRKMIESSGEAWTKERIQKSSPEEILEMAGKLMSKLSPVLAGQHPSAVGPALAAMLALWIAGNHPGIQEKQFQAVFDTVREMYPQYSADLWKHLLDG